MVYNKTGAFMLVKANIRNMYEKIQKQLFYMIPEKWDRVYLYASVIDHFNGLQTGEMFFYYFPKGIIKKNPINVYEVPKKFNIDEQAYLKLAEKLYEDIKNLRKKLIELGEKPWTNVTISIENFKFNAIYSYENLKDSKYTSYDRHLIWRYQYLNIPLSSYSKKERKMIEEYLAENKNSKNENTYQEGIYKKPVKNIIEYNKQENSVWNDTGKEDTASNNNVEVKKKENEKINSNVDIENEKEIITNQILNITNN
jgi:hypothetical protein